ncbi:MAG: hypothetical protein V4625_10770 [Pseudomonadota bacterium]
MAALRESGPFDVLVDTLKAFKPDEAVELFSDLLRTELIRTGRPVAQANVPRAITTADGGVDADIDLGPGAFMPFGLLCEGKVRYQIKTGSFSASTPGDIKSLLLKAGVAGGGPFTPEDINDRVKYCLDNGGTFVAVLFGSDAVGTSEDYGSAQLKELAVQIDPTYERCTFKVLRANQIAAAITAISPATALRLNGLAGQQGAPFHQLKYLGESCDLEVGRYQSTPELDATATEITRDADALQSFRHIRVLGDAGSGKTHLVYRALTQSASSMHVLYCKDSEALATSPAFWQLLELSRSANIILVADECPVGNAAALQSQLKNVAAHLLLITIYNQYDGDDALGGDLAMVEVSPLAVAPMAQIFGSYGIPEEKQTWLAQLCEGSPRAAHQIGRLISVSPEVEYSEHFHKLDWLWKQIICSPEGKDSDVGSKRLTVARCVALFRDLYWGRLDGGASRKIFEKVVQQVDPGITTAVLNNSIEALRARRVLQGTNTLYLSPKLLHIKMWVDLWDNFEHKFDEQWFKDNLTIPMMEKLFAMFEFAKESKAATRFVEEILIESASFSSLASFAGKGNAALFFALAQADSKAALRRLRYTLEAASLAERKAFREGRREVVYGLERLAVFEENFFDAADCLLLLAEQENESWSNNATGTFVSLFTLGYGKIAASQMSPLDKLPYLERQLRGSSHERRTIILKALSESLSPFLSRVDIGESSGLRLLPKRWTPATYSDLWACYAGHVDLLITAFDFLQGKDRSAAAHAVMNHIRSLFLIPLLEERLIKALRRFAEFADLKGEVVEKVASVLHYEGKSLRVPLQVELADFLKALTETTFHDRMRRYVGLRLLEDSFDDSGEYTELPKTGLLELRDEAIASPDLLTGELAWVVSSEAKNGFQFGELLGFEDLHLSLFTQIFDAWEVAGTDRSDYFFGGYLHGLFKQDEGLWSLVMGELFAIVPNGSDLLQLAWRSGMNEEVAQALFELMLQRRIQPREFRILVYGAVVRQIPLDFLQGIVKTLISSSDPVDADTALDLLESRRRSVPADTSVLLELYLPTLSHKTFLAGHKKEEGWNNMRNYHWNEAAKLLLEKNPQSALELATEGVRTFGKSGTITDAYGKEGTAFFDEVIQKYPAEIWPAIAAQLEVEGDGYSYRMLHWLRGARSDGGIDSPTGLDLMPPKPVLDWVNSDPARRAPLIAEYAPPIIGKAADSEKSLLRQILESFGVDKEVRSAAHANYWTGVFSGPASEHYRHKKSELETILASETSSPMRIWIKEEIENLEHQIEHSKDQEDARF